MFKIALDESSRVLLQRSAGMSTWNPSSPGENPLRIKVGPQTWFEQFLQDYTTEKHWKTMKTLLQKLECSLHWVYSGRTAFWILNIPSRQVQQPMPMERQLGKWCWQCCANKAAAFVKPLANSSLLSSSQFATLQREKCIMQIRTGPKRRTLIPEIPWISSNAIRCIARHCTLFITFKMYKPNVWDTREVH